MKTCTKCKIKKPESEFYRDSRTDGKLMASCKQCKSSATRKWWKANDYDKTRYKKNKHSERNRHLRKKYGITDEDYAEMLKSQKGKCAICGAGEPGTKKFDVDHCHVTGVVRGLLCTSCNRMLGHSGDRPEVLAAGEKYLLSSRKSRRSSSEPRGIQ